MRDGPTAADPELLQKALEVVPLAAKHIGALAQRAYAAELDRALGALPKSDPPRLELSGFKVFSMHGQDGVLQEIFRRIGTTNKRFVEFGAQDGLQCNARLLFWTGWTGLWIEAGELNAERLRSTYQPALEDGRLKFAEAFVTSENINDLLRENSASGEIDLLVIDVDGNDIHIFEAIDAVLPRVVCIEYNGSFPPPIDFVRPYDPAHVWDKSLYYGASLAAMQRVFSKKGYQLVGTDICGADAFFVRGDLIDDRFHAPGDVATLYNPPRYGLGPGFPIGHKAPAICPHPV